MLLVVDEEEPAVDVLDDLLPLSADLVSEPLLLLAAGALPEDEPRLSVR